MRLSPAPALQYKVQDSNGNVIPVQVDANVDFPSLYTLSFPVMVPPMGYHTYFIATAAGTPATSPSSTPSGAFSISNSYVRLPNTDKHLFIHTHNNVAYLTSRTPITNLHRNFRASPPAGDGEL